MANVPPTVAVKTAKLFGFVSFLYLITLSSVASVVHFPLL